MKNNTSEFPDHGDQDSSHTLSDEELRCYTGLQNYYLKIEGHNNKKSSELAWADLKNEFPNLKEFNQPSQE